MNNMARIAILSTLFLVSFGCSRSQKWNVLIVTFDTTRADRLACYGSQTIKTPNIDALAQDGVLFEKAFTPVPITLPSHTSMMTGKVPFAHGVRDNGLFSVGPQQRTLAEILSEKGYATGAAIGSFPLTSQFGINQGFDFYEDHITASFENFFGNRNSPKQRLYFDERKAGQVNEALIPWLEDNHDKPFFAWAHYFDPHQPHEPPPPFNQLYASDLYDGEIAYADQSFGVLVSKLKSLGVYDKTIIVFAADHGEGCGDHNEVTHSMLVYNATLHVPLVIKAPEMAKSRRIAQHVGTVDILPTILDLIGEKPPADIQGRSLKALLDPNTNAPSIPETLYYAETLSPRLGHGWGELRALFDGDYKYIYGPRKELYKVIPDDHRELRNLVDDEPEIAQRMKIKLQQYLDEHAVSGLDASVDLDEATMERLLALGYVHSSGDKVGAIEEVLRDDGTPPQDRVVDNGLFSTAKNFLFQGKALEASEATGGLLKRNPDNPFYMELHANALRQLGQYDKALSALEKVLDLNLGIPPVDQVLLRMGRLYFLMGQPQKGLECFLKSQDAKKTAEGQFAIASYYNSIGQAASAKPYMEETIRLQPHYAPAKLAYAIMLAKENQIEGAESAFKAALVENPYSAKACYNYGTFLVNQEKPDQAKAMFHRAVEIDSNYAQAYYALVTLAVRGGEKDAAWDYFFQLTEADRQGRYIEQAQALLAEAQ